MRYVGVVIRTSLVVSLLTAASSLLANNNIGKRPVGGSHRLPNPLFTSDPITEPTSTTKIKASATTQTPQTESETTSKTTTNNNNNQSNNAFVRDRQRKKYKARRRPPAVDSTLLRFVHEQKSALDKPQTMTDDASNNNVESSNEVLPELIPYSAPGALEEDNTNDAIQNNRTSTTTTTNPMKANAEQLQPQPQPPSKQLEDDDEDEFLMSFWGHFNRYRVETILIAKDPDLDPNAAAKAGASVQSQIQARTVRRRIRTFLKNRDQTWKSDWVSSLAISTAGDIDGFTGSHTFEDAIDVMMSHGLTAKDITDILQHSPGTVLMRPRGSENGECLDDTIDRVFKLLCVTLKLRKYDARKIVRDSPGLLTMRGSKSAVAVVSLLSQLGISPNAVARDKSALALFLSRSPSSIFRLVAFLSSDAIRMPVDKIGPLLRRPVCRELLDAVAPVSWQPDNLRYSDSSMTMTQTIIQDELDQSLGRPSQISRYQVNELYDKMTKTAWTLRKEVGTADLSKVVAAYPSVLLLNAEEQVLPNADFLMERLRICKGDLPRVLHLYPKLLGLPEEEMEAVSNYLLSLGVDPEDLPSVFRSFPALLTMDIEADMEPVVGFLESIGVMDIGRFVTRIPPVLGYSVEDELEAKWQYLKSVSSDARFEVTKFPAYFSYPLEKVIRARYEYIRDVKQYPTQLITADRVLSYGDRDFAIKVLRDKDGGREFQEFLDQRRPKKQKTKKKKRPA